MALSAAVRAISRLRVIEALPLLRMRGSGRRATSVSWRGGSGRGRQNLIPPSMLARLAPPAVMLGAIAVPAR